MGDDDDNVLTHSQLFKHLTQILVDPIIGKHLGCFTHFLPIHATTTAMAAATSTGLPMVIFAAAAISTLTASIGSRTAETTTGVGAAERSSDTNEVVQRMGSLSCLLQSHKYTNKHLQVYKFIVKYVII